MTVTRAEHGINVLTIRRATVRVEGGQEAAQQLRIEDPIPLTIGTAPDSALRLRDEHASRRHLRVALVDKGVAVTDEGSRNGTWLGGVRITNALLTTDTRLRVGGTTLLVTLDTDPSEVPLSDTSSFGGARGLSAVTRHVFARLERAAETDIAVLLEGESGVGKEVLARAIHATSRRAAGPLVTVDCGAITASLFESELFGHERGAFTGADAAREGLVARADGGTLFLDEIGELPLELQPKLLRLLELHEMRPVGGRDVRRVDVRVIAATNRALLSEVQAGRFRKDLYYRLAVARVKVPALRDRPEDVELLATTFFRDAVRDDQAELPADVLALFRAYAWPGNVRELKNVVQRYAHLGFSEGDLFDPTESAPSSSPAPASASHAGAMDSLPSELLDLPYHQARQRLLDRFEMAYVPHVLARAGGVVSRAAELARIARPTFYRLVERLQARNDGAGASSK